MREEETTLFKVTAVKSAVAVFRLGFIFFHFFSLPLSLCGSEKRSMALTHEIIGGRSEGSVGGGGGGRRDGAEQRLPHFARESTYLLSALLRLFPVEELESASRVPASSGQVNQLTAWQRSPSKMSRPCRTR